MKRIFFIPIDKSNLDYLKMLIDILNKVMLCKKNGFQVNIFSEHLTNKLSSSLMMISAFYQKEKIVFMMNL